MRLVLKYEFPIKKEPPNLFFRLGFAVLIGIYLFTIVLMVSSIRVLAHFITEVYMITVTHQVSKTGRFRDYSLIAGLDNVVSEMEVGDTADIINLERVTGETHKDYSVFKGYLARIRKAGGPVCRMKAMGEYAVILRVK